ncbi:YceI family protein [Sabulilitoribacter multivorans]|uniref:YceI family protein n=1 Tax=Flaviramulus multivorans TaxID=1304750 RepID=A0ABS9ILF8_9FLAO|nr:YceI family protein [Flaviramulus multivorans]MCF7561434.1 YceI family protein [Flaviramulus multivorans]
MNNVKKILLLISIMLTLAFSVVLTGNTTVLITPESKLLIKGKTNINSFKCEFDILKLKKPIPVFFQKIDDKMVFDNTVLVLENNCFDCGGKAINSDFQELLKSDVYPNTQIKLKEICKDANNKNKVLAFLDITIAGVTKSCSIPVQLKGEETLLIEGVLSLNICDFNLEPPTKALGLIVVKDMIDVNFQLVVKEY